MASAAVYGSGGPQAPPRVLLIVDDTPEVARGLEKALRKHFDKIHVAYSPLEAERTLRTAADAPTHLICDDYFRSDRRRGMELVPLWRRAFPSLLVAVILTGSQIQDLEPVAGIDSIFRKPTEIDSLIDLMARPKAYDVV